MTIRESVQQLEPGPLMEFWEVDASALGGGVSRFHGHNDQNIVWQGLTYAPWPINGEGFERTTAQQPQPKLMVGNVDGSISQLCVAYDDMVGAIVTRRRTFAKFLDGQPDADPSQEFMPELWFIERKEVESRKSVTFELSSALDFQGQQLPGRQIIADSCPAQWVYRGENCGYTGPPVAELDDTPTTDPLLDNCGKRLRSCRMRLWPDGVLNYGGYAAAGLVRTS